jgi:hypothetical protein
MYEQGCTFGSLTRGQGIHRICTGFSIVARDSTRYRAKN